MMSEISIWTKDGKGQMVANVATIVENNIRFQCGKQVQMIKNLELIIKNGWQS